MTCNPKYSEAIVQKLRKRLSKMCAGDAGSIMAALDIVCNQIRGLNSPYQYYLKIFREAIAVPGWHPTEQDAILVSKQLREKLVKNTTEKLFPQPRPNTIEKTYNQLTLDFLDTIEKTFDLSHEEPSRTVSGEPPRPRDAEQLICKEYNSGHKEPKGWLTPQYKYTSVFAISHTSTNPDNFPGGKVYGPYWVYCWYRPGKADGQIYLGGVKSKKFQHFSIVWKQCDSATEIVELLRKGFHRD